MMDVGKKGVRFKDVAKKVAKFYEKKGYSKKKAEEVERRLRGKSFGRNSGRRGEER